MEDKRPLCKYGEKCYQKNPQHQKNYKHPPKLTKANDKKESKNKRKLNTLDAFLTHKTKLQKKEEPEKKNDDTASKSTEEIEKEPKEELKLTEELESDKNEQNKTKIQTSDDKDYALAKEFIKTHFLVDMPSDFYSFWEFCKSLKENDPLNALENIDLLLVGPFDVLAEKFDGVSKSADEYLRHWRYYYDPPELQTVIKSYQQDGFHIGYFRDDPGNESDLVCSGTLTNGQLQVIGDNLFAAVNNYLENYIKTKCTPFNKAKMVKFQSDLIDWAKDKNYEIKCKTESMKKRNFKVVTKLFSGIGLVVPYNKKTQLGYRPLIETAANIKKMSQYIVEANDDNVRDSFFSKLQPVITMASIAADECDFGTPVELALDFFTFGGEVFHSTILSLLVSGYSLLNRDAFAEIIQAHLKDRRKSNNLSIL